MSKTFLVLLNLLAMTQFTHAAEQTCYESYASIVGSEKLASMQNDYQKASGTSGMAALVSSVATGAVSLTVLQLQYPTKILENAFVSGTTAAAGAMLGGGVVAGLVEEWHQPYKKALFIQNLSDDAYLGEGPALDTMTGLVERSLQSKTPVRDRILKKIIVDIINTNPNVCASDDVMAIEKNVSALAVAKYNELVR